MIIKSFEINKIKLDKDKIILFYGQNEGLKDVTVKNLIKGLDKNIIFYYEEREVLEKSDNFIENILSKSFFEKKKVIIIKRVTEKILNILSLIKERNTEGISIILNASNLEKKSKLRSYFEKDKNNICVPFYLDDQQTLAKLSISFFKKLGIPISQSDLNLIIGICNGDRINLLNEFQKIEQFSINRKNISTDEIIKLINITENHSVSKLIDYCLVMNNKQVINILNENNFAHEDSILIVRTFLNKAKKILKLSSEYKKNKNIDLTVDSAKPPIFWKDKEMIKQQIIKWKPENLKELIYNLLEVELMIKKNFNNSVNLIGNFLLETSMSNNKS